MFSRSFCVLCFFILLHLLMQPIPILFHVVLPHPFHTCVFLVFPTMPIAFTCSYSSCPFPHHIHLLFLPPPSHHIDLPTTTLYILPPAPVCLTGSPVLSHNSSTYSVLLFYFVVPSHRCPCYHCTFPFSCSSYLVFCVPCTCVPNHHLCFTLPHLLCLCYNTIPYCMLHSHIPHFPSTVLFHPSPPTIFNLPLPLLPHPTAFSIVQCLQTTCAPCHHCSTHSFSCALHVVSTVLPHILHACSVYIPLPYHFPDIHHYCCLGYYH